MGRLLKLAVVVVILFLAWKYGLPWIQRQTASSSASKSDSSQSSCTGSAARASEAWGSGLHNFVNPPYDLGAWSSFRSDVESKISAAESECSCSSESCTKTRNAMHDLRSLISDLDTAVRNGSAPPSDAVQRQEAIDRQIEDAAQLVREGK